MNKNVERMRELRHRKETNTIMCTEIEELKELEALVGKKTIHSARYCNNGEASAAIVAVVTECVDWSCYFGVSINVEHERDCILDVANNGDKMSEADAHHFFPNIDLPYRD